VRRSRSSQILGIRVARPPSSLEHFDHIGAVRAGGGNGLKRTRLNLGDDANEGTRAEADLTSDQVVHSGCRTPISDARCLRTDDSLQERAVRVHLRAHALMGFSLS
jgi:hypothetical protein